MICLACLKSDAIFYFKFLLRRLVGVARTSGHVIQRVWSAWQETALWRCWPRELQPSSLLMSETPPTTTSQRLVGSEVNMGMGNN